MNLFKYGKIPPLTYFIVIVVGILMYLGIFYLEILVGVDNSKSIHDWTEKCVIPCKDKKLCDELHKYRDDHYYVFEKDTEKCLVTKWEISHLITHIFLGYFTNIYISQGISIGFELYEHYHIDCGSYIDLVYNFVGFLIGHTLKNIINPSPLPVTKI